MSDLDTLWPEENGLAKRLLACADEVAAFPHPSHCDHLHDAAALMRDASAELLRLTRENDEWQTRCLQLQTERDMARAELAALRARIAEAPVVACPKTLVHAGNTMQTEFLEYMHERMPGGCNSWAGKRVRLLVEE